MQPPPIPMSPQALKRTAELLAIAKKPIFYVGQGGWPPPPRPLAPAPSPTGRLGSRVGAFESTHQLGRGLAPGRATPRPPPHTPRTDACRVAPPPIVAQAPTTLRLS